MSRVGGTARRVGGGGIESARPTFAPSVLQDPVEAAERRQLQRQAERVDGHAHQAHHAGVLQRVQRRRLLTELTEAAARLRRPQTLHHGV